MQSNNFPSLSLTPRPRPNFLILTLMFLFLLKANALPSSARLFQQNYGFKVSCNLCHSNGGGSAPNNYGKAFLRAGANSSAFKKIENNDSDEDGFTNVKEILAKSNPGDKQSTITSQGDWLANAGSIFIPQKELERIFPGLSKFSAIEGSLNTKQLEFLKSKLGKDPVDDDKVPTFYFAEKDGKKVAVGQFISQQLGEGKGLNTGIAVSTNGKIMKVEILGGTEAKAANQNSSYIDSLKEKSSTDLPPLPADASAKLISASVERSLYLIQAVFGGIK